MADTTTFSNNLRIAMVASPGMGHLIPVIVLANTLAARHNVKVTVLQVSSSSFPSPDSDVLRIPANEELVQVRHLPAVDVSHLVGPSTKVSHMITIMVRESMPLVRDAVAAMDPPPDALFTDFFGCESVSVAEELSLPKYVYITSNAKFAALLLYSPVLDGVVKGQYVDQDDDFKIPGCSPVRPEDVVDPMLDRGDPGYPEYLKMGEKIALFDGILCNTWEELEGKTLLSFRDSGLMGSVVKSPIYPIGPLTRPAEPAGRRSKVLEWLDKQPIDSVIFVSFGSGGVLSDEQMVELAWGLEMSRQRFVWVVRPPTKGGSDDAFFNQGRAAAAPDFLPREFTELTRDRGFLVPCWAPQVEILGHPSVGGFLSHGGWNSTLEGIKGGVPMISWPLYAEQKLNATLLSEDIGISLRTRVLPTKKVVGREEIEELVRTLMVGGEGRLIRDKVKELRESARRALECRRGSSYKSLCEVLSRITKKAADV